MRVVVAMVVATWAVLWAAHGRPGERRRDKRVLGQRTCPMCYSRNTGASIMAHPVTGSPTGTAMYCYSCKRSFDFKYWDGT